MRKDIQWMLLRSLLGSIICFSSGIGVAAGTFAFLLVIRVRPRMLQKAGLEQKVIYIENMVVKGVLFGTLFSLFFWKKKWLFALLGRALLTIFGISAGIFNGCIAVALAEILDTFPIFFRRLHLNEGLIDSLLLVMAIGKMVGSLFYFVMGYGIITSH